MRGETPERLDAPLQVAWKFETPAEEGKRRPPIDASPVIAGGKVFVGSQDGSFYAIDLKSGALPVTTRPRRPSQVDGVHYHFVDVPTFEAMRDRGDLLEWAEVHGNYYATPRGPVELALAEGRDILLEIDVQGTLQIYERMRQDVVSVFILPPSIAELQNRLRRRAEDEDQVIRRRLVTAENEIAHWSDYDYVLVNYDLERCYKQLQQILATERLRRHRQPHLAPAIAVLLEDLSKVLLRG